MLFTSPTCFMVGAHAFYLCIHLEYVVIPESLISFGDESFRSCSSLKSIFYQGTENLEFGVFEGCKLSDVCVPPDYNYSSIFGVPLTPNSSLCNEFCQVFNNCYKGSYKDGEVISEKWRHVREREKQSNGCYLCDIQSDSIQWNKCNNSENHTCLNGDCINGTQLDDKWIVIIEMNNTKAGDINIQELIDTISEITGIKKDNIMVGIETDDNGDVISILVYLDSEEEAKSVSEVASCGQDTGRQT